MGAIKPPDLGPGWVERVEHQRGDTEGDARLRARGAAPFKAKRQSEQAVTVRRGGMRGRASRRLDRVFAADPVDELDE